MSYNIDTVEIVHKKGFCITRTKLEALGESIDQHTESTVFDLLTESSPARWMDIVKGPDGVELICPRQFWWHGEGSGHDTDALAEVLAAFEGEADLVLTWEGGDSHSGLRLRNHGVTKHEVVLALGEEQSE